MTTLDYVFAMFVITYITFGAIIYILASEIDLVREKVKELIKETKENR